jgi:hypothetical protein
MISAYTVPGLLGADHRFSGAPYYEAYLPTGK